MSGPGFAVLARGYEPRPEPPAGTPPLPAPVDDRRGYTPRLRAFLAIGEERDRQDRKWGADRHHVGVPYPAARAAKPRLPRDLAEWAARVLRIPTSREARERCEAAAKAGGITWAHILVEEVAEAIEAGAVATNEELRAELVQVAAVVVAWLEDLSIQEGRS